MKKVFVWVVSYISGYTSEADIFLFHNEKDAQEKFDEVLKSSLIEQLTYMGLTIEGVKNMSQEEREKLEIYIDSDHDITWEGREVYKRVFMYKSEVL